MFYCEVSFSNFEFENLSNIFKINLDNNRLLKM